jgi:hypothetical protein
LFEHQDLFLFYLYYVPYSHNIASKWKYAKKVAPSTPLSDLENQKNTWYVTIQRSVHSKNGLKILLWNWKTNQSTLIKDRSKSWKCTLLIYLFWSQNTLFELKNIHKTNTLHCRLVSVTKASRKPTTNPTDLSKPTCTIFVYICLILWSFLAVILFLKKSEIVDIKIKKCIQCSD